MTLLEALKKVQAGNRLLRSGICASLVAVVPYNIKYQPLLDELDQLFRCWHKFSGTVGFPVPCPELGSPEDAYIKVATNSTQQTLWEGPYGALRIELLDWCINYLESKS